MEKIYLQILDQSSDISGMALATVTWTSGSTPQKPGSSALFSGKGLIAGTVGGGIVEGKVHQIAGEVLRTKQSGHYVFNLANDISKTEEAICGGQIRVLIDANLQNSVSVFEQMKQSLEKGMPGVLITMVTGFNENTVLINRYWMSQAIAPELPQEFMQKIEPAVSEMLSGSDKSDYREMEMALPGEEPVSLFLLEPVFPLPKLVIAGAGHIGRSLAHLAKRLGFEVTVIDDRKEHANSENIPDASHIVVMDIGKAMESLKKDGDTYVVIVTRGHKDDAAALRPCLGTDLAYIGMIGSRHKIASMRENFIQNGWARTDQWDFIKAPVGIDIKSQSVEEIAVSIAAQLILVRNSRKAEVLLNK